ncbi:hypothetical protein FRC07_012322 [Ceratobasidium sp. 392]|nr:hypothetical protein FRC07_012322 [Ceratobasidium sp. 392]
MREDYAYKCSTRTDDKLIFKELSHRRSIASYVTSFTLTAGLTITTMTGAAPLTIPVCAFKAYKIASHKFKLKLVRAELARRNLSPSKKRKRDVLIPVAVALSVYVITLGLADVIDIVPSDVQGALEGHIEAAVGFAQGTLGEEGVGNTYEAFVLMGAVPPLTNPAIHSKLPARNLEETSDIPQ